MIVELGNPGARYASTRHNIGFMVVDTLVGKQRASWTEINKDVLQARIDVSSTELYVIKTLTYMNLTGTAVAPLARSYGLHPSQVVAITDEYNFPTGRIHLRRGGSSGGHNGIESLIENLESSDFWRLRCGIDRKFGPGELVDYVLSPFPPEEEVAVTRMVENAVLAIEAIAKGGPDQAMQEINRA